MHIMRSGLWGSCPIALCIHFRMLKQYAHSNHREEYLDSFLLHRHVEGYLCTIFAKEARITAAASRFTSNHALTYDAETLAATGTRLAAVHFSYGATHSGKQS